MSAQSNRRPSEVANRLGVSVSTLRRWSQQFATFLSGFAQSSDEDSPRHRRYTDEDLDALITIKGLLTEGYTYSQVRSRLQSQGVGASLEGESYALVASEDPPPGLAPAVSILSETLHTVADGQQLLLNSQQVNRDLLSMTIQDNFNLKAENAKLRDRMLELERSLSEIRRQDAIRWQDLEARLLAVEDTLTAMAQQTEDYYEEQPGGFWSRFRGR